MAHPFTCLIAASAVLTFGLCPVVAQSVRLDHERDASVVSPQHGDPSASTPAPAAETMPAWASLFIELPRDVRRLPSETNARWLVGAGAAALAMRGQDTALTRKAMGSARLGTLLGAGAFVGGGLLQVGGALGTFAIGRWSGRPEVASVASGLVRAQIVNTGITHGIKVAVRRRRPDGTQFSFPSGHASSNFATATVLQQRLGWRAGVPAFAMATYVATSRLQENKHYLSDVVFGAAIGIVSARGATLGHRRHAFMLVPLAALGGVGVGVGVGVARVGPSP